MASALAEELERNGYRTEVLDLRDRTKEHLDRFDLVVLGSSIIIGKWSKEAQEFLAAHSASLPHKKVALFACYSDVLFPDKIEDARKMYLDTVSSG